MVNKTRRTRHTGKADGTLAMLTDLMAVPGPSGQESAIAEEVTRRLLAAGLGPKAISSDTAHRKSSRRGGQRGNLIVKLPGTVRRPRRLFVAHMDTVPLCVGARPVRRGGRIVSADKSTGVGGDNRAGVAILVATLLEILAGDLPHPPLTFLWTVQEEVGLKGARHVSLGKLGRPVMGFNYDGDEGVIVGATGAYRMEITVHGIASHAGTAPQEGVNAMTIASLAMADLHRTGWLGAVKKGRKTGASNIGVVEAGSAVNVVCPRAAIQAEVRSHDPAFRRRMLEEFRTAFQRAARSVRTDSGRCGTVDFASDLDYESFRLANDEPAVVKAVEAFATVGAAVRPKVMNGGLDANWLVVHGIPVVTIGTGNRNAHTTAETLEVPGFQQACRVTRYLATDVS